MTSFDCTILLSSCCNFFCCFSNFSFSDNSFSLSSVSVSFCSFSRWFVAVSSDTSCRIASPSFRICSVSCPAAICWWRISDNSSLLPEIVCSSSATSFCRSCFSKSKTDKCFSCVPFFSHSMPCCNIISASCSFSAATHWLRSVSLLVPPLKPSSASAFFNDTLVSSPRLLPVV